MTTNNYKVHLISDNESLRRKMEKVTYFDKIKMNISIDSIDEDIAIIEDSIISINDLLERKDKIESEYIFYRVSHNNFRFSTKSILESNNIILINPYMTDENLIEFVCQNVIKAYKLNVNNNIITFFGADTKVGTTQIAQNVAEKITDRTNAKVCLIFLDGEASTDYININFKDNLDSIKIKLISGLVSVDEILDIAETSKNKRLLIIEGTKSILYRKEYQPDHISQLLNILSLTFDAVIVDAGSYVDRAMSISALTATSRRYLVTTQQTNSLRRYNEKKSILEILSLDDFQIIVNKHMQEGSLLTNYDIAKTYCQPFLTKISFSRYALESEKDRKALMHYNDKEFNKDINKLTDAIIHQIDLVKTEIPKKKKWFKGVV